REPRVSVGGGIIPLLDDRDRHYLGREVGDTDQVGVIAGMVARCGRTYAGEPDYLVEELAKDDAIREAHTLLVTVPNMLGVEYNAHLLEGIVKHVAPALGWR